MRQRMLIYFLPIFLLLLASCTVSNQEQAGQLSHTESSSRKTQGLPPTTSPGPKENEATPQKKTLAVKGEGSYAHADVLSVSVSGSEYDYRFSVEISSPDQGCEQYADWWEVISEDGETLIYRRVLLHSHTDVQPFSRSGGPVSITSDQIVIVRGHFHPDGYGGRARKGSVTQGFVSIDLPDNFAEDLSEMEPLPEDCAF